jgi:ubiquinone/menaquinone biosynthesis C-methylase UbiE
MTTQQIDAFTNVDRTEDPEFYLRFLDEGNALESIQAAKPIILDQLRLRDHQHILDAGCGTGEDVVELAARVGPSGQATGVDISHTMVDEARRRAHRSTWRVKFQAADVRALPFADREFDACRAERLLMHVPDPELAIAELLRVTKPGGRICVFDFDWDSHFVDSPYRDTTRAIVRSFADGIRNGWIARQLPRLLADHGAINITYRAHTVFLDRSFYELLLGGHLRLAQAAGKFTPDELGRWRDHLRNASDKGTFLAGVTAMIVAATRP